MLAHEIITGVQQKITVMLDQTTDDILKEFRCNGCGAIMFQYYGSIKLLLPGAVELPWINVVGRPMPIMCKNKSRKILVPDEYGESMKELIVKCKTTYYVIG